MSFPPLENLQKLPTAPGSKYKFLSLRISLSSEAPPSTIGPSSPEGHTQFHLQCQLFWLGGYLATAWEELRPSLCPQDGVCMCLLFHFHLCCHCFSVNWGFWGNTVGNVHLLINQLMTDSGGMIMRTGERSEKIRHSLHQGCERPLLGHHSMHGSQLESLILQ